MVVEALSSSVDVLTVIQTLLLIAGVIGVSHPVFAASGGDGAASECDDDDLIRQVREWTDPLHPMGVGRGLTNDLADCAHALRRKAEARELAAMVDRAQGQLGLRASARTRLIESGVEVLESRGDARLCFSTATVMTPFAWEAMGAFQSTFPTHRISMQIPHFPGRHGLEMVLRAIREGRVSRERVYGRNDDGDSLCIEIQGHPPSEVDLSPPKGIVVQPVRETFVVGVEKTIEFDILLLDPGRYKGWILRIIKDGVPHGKIEGIPDVTNRASWDGTGHKGLPVPPGIYGVSLTAISWRGDDDSDSASFKVESVPSPSLPDKDASSVRHPGVPLVRQHRFIIRFEEGTSLLVERDREILERVAYLMAINPQEHIVVTGHWSEGERLFPGVAVDRARRIKAELLSLGVSSVRVRENATAYAARGPSVGVNFDQELETHP